MDDRLIGRLLHPGLLFRVGGSVQQGFRPAGRVRFFQHKAVLPAAQQHIRTAVGGGQHHPAEEHRLQQHHAENFVLRRQQEEIRLLVDPLHLILGGFFLPEDAAFQPLFPDGRFHAVQILRIAVADDVKAGVRVAFPHFGQHIQQEEGVPPGLDAADVKQLQARFLRPHLLLEFRLPRVRAVTQELPVDADAHRRHLLRRETLFQKEFPGQLALGQKTGAAAAVAPHEEGVEHSAHPVIVLVEGRVVGAVVDHRLFGVFPRQMPREHLVILGGLQHIIPGKELLLPFEPDVFEQDFPVAVEDMDGLCPLHLDLYGHLVAVRPEQDVGGMAALHQRLRKSHFLDIVGVLGHIQHAGPGANDEYFHSGILTV